jgi:general secretion pathway protein N
MKMLKCPEIIALALLSVGLLVTGPVPKLFAATSATQDILSDDGPGGVSGMVDVGSVKPLAKANRDAGKPFPGGNPLWSVPLSVLTATQEHPIFSASRRPPQRAVIAPHVDQVQAPVPVKTAEPERPALALIGAVVGDSDAIAVFLDRTNQKIIRLRQGETHAGWVLSSVQRREVTLRKGDRAEVLALQRPEAAAPTAVPGLTSPTVGNTSFAPFVPRSTPQNGEPDGL